MQYDPSPRLWQGGPWEQPQREPVSLPARSGPGGRRAKKRSGGRKKRRGWLGFGVLLGLIASLTLAAAVISWMDLPGYLDEMFPQWYEDWAGGGDDYYDDGWDDYAQTTIPRAPAGGDTRMELNDSTDGTLTLQEIYDKCLPSIVYIQCTQGNSVSAGSGVILSADGYIITNAHVIAGAQSAQVILYDNTTLEARLVGAHADQDLAVLKVEATDLTPAEFGNSGQLRVGDSVVAIGNPLGSTLRGTMTEGIVSAINRSVDVDGVTMSLIQTTAALNPGNSGGALINAQGQVVGITTLKMMSSYETIEGLGFAIPSRFAKSMVDQIIATGVARTPALGITVINNVARYGGLLVHSVDERSDAYAKGLQVDDVIIAANGVSITDSSTLTIVKEPLGVGDVIILTVLRDGQQLDIPVELIDSELLN